MMVSSDDIIEDSNTKKYYKVSEIFAKPLILKISRGKFLLLWNLGLMVQDGEV